MKRWFVAIALLATGVAPAHVKAAGGGVRALNLTLADLPTGFTLKAVTNPTAALAAKEDGTSVAQLAKWGRVTSNEVEYTGSSIVGILDIDSIIEQFHTAPQAEAQYVRSLAGLAKQKTIVLHPMSIKAVGTERAAWTGQVKKGGITGEADFVFFKRGAYVVAVTITGLAGTMKVSELDTLAHAVDGRIQRAG